ncbi:MAG TPA: hypothetical protein VMN36_02060 [Verrucomicrobiales bacterium]|nr:hypothetical protein [Verrucomicrobiales bacterium]
MSARHSHSRLLLPLLLAAAASAALLAQDEAPSPQPPPPETEAPAVSAQPPPAEPEIDPFVFPGFEDTGAPPAGREGLASGAGDLFDTSAFDTYSQLVDEGLHVAAPGGVSLSPETKVITATGGVEINYQDLKLYAERAEIDLESRDIFLHERVRIYRGDLVFHGDTAAYNLDSKRITASSLKSSLDPLLYETTGFSTTIPELTGLNTLSGSESVFTTHDSSDPNYRIQASSMRIDPKSERVEMRDVTFFAGDTPVFWLPYLSQYLDDELGWYVRPGTRSNWGASLLGQYGFLLGEHSLLKTQLDLRWRRGAAGGLELLSQRHRENPNYGRFKAYYAYDLDPDIAVSSRFRRPLNEDRYRLNLQHRIYLPGPDASDLYLDFDINKLSDEFLYEDFFPAEYQIDPRPDNLVNLVHHRPWGTASLLGRFRWNDFFRTDSREPELALDFTRQPILRSGIFYEGQTSAGIYRERLTQQETAFVEDGEGSFEDLYGVDPNDLDSTLVDQFLDDLAMHAGGYSFKRFDSAHQFIYPKTLGGWLSLMPRAGVRYTRYFDIDSGDPSAPASDDRALFHAGASGSFKISRVFSNVRVPAWGIDQLRHVAQPYFDYSFVEADELDPGVPRIDRLLPTTLARPLNPVRFTAIDDLASWNILRLGIRNSLQTRRDGQTYQWLTLNTFFDTFLEDPEFDRDFSNLYNEIEWKPLPWVRLAMDSQVPIFGQDEDFVEFNSRLRFMPTHNLEFSVGHRFLSNHPLIGDSDLVSVRAYARLGETWGLGFLHRYELEDNTLEVQQYSLHRDLTSWTAAIGAVIRDHRGKDEYGLLLTLTLKDFPQLSLPLSIDQESSAVEP